MKRRLSPNMWKQCCMWKPHNPQKHNLWEQITASYVEILYIMDLLLNPREPKSHPTLNVENTLPHHDYLSQSLHGETNLKKEHSCCFHDETPANIREP